MGLFGTIGYEMPTQRRATDTVQLKVRVREDLRAQLERAATERDVSLNTEIAERLAKSFEAQSQLQAAVEAQLGGAHTAALLKLTAARIQLIEVRTGKRWIDDPLTTLEVRKAWAEVLDAIPLPGPSALRSEIRFLFRSVLGDQTSEESRGLAEILRSWIEPVKGDVSSDLPLTFTSRWSRAEQEEGATRTSTGDTEQAPPQSRKGDEKSDEGSH
jgi:hypothetical protein